MTPINSPWMLLGFAALGIGLAPLVTPQNKDREKRRAESRAKLANLTLAERDRLQHNFRVFQELPEVERQQCREFLGQLQNDAALNNGRNVQIFDDYLAWLKTISPYYRAKLAETKTPPERLAQLEKTLKEPHSAPSDKAFDLFEGNDNPRLPSLTAEELEKTFEFLETKIPMSNTEVAAVTALKGVDRYLKQVEFVLNAPPRSVGAGLVSALNSLSNPDVARLLEFSKNKEEFRLPRLILCKALKHAFVEEHRRQQPSEQEMRSMLNLLPGEEQSDLLELGAEDFKTRLSTLVIDREKKQIEILKKLAGHQGERRAEGNRPGRGAKQGVPRPVPAPTSSPGF